MGRYHVIITRGNDEGNGSTEIIKERKWLIAEYHYKERNIIRRGIRNVIRKGNGSTVIVSRGNGSLTNRSNKALPHLCKLKLLNGYILI